MSSTQRLLASGSSQQRFGPINDHKGIKKSLHQPCLVGLLFHHVVLLLERFVDFFLFSFFFVAFRSAFKIFDTVNTIYGNGFISAVRPDCYVVQLTNWALAQGQSPTLYLQEDAIK